MLLSLCGVESLLDGSEVGGSPVETRRCQDKGLAIVLPTGTNLDGM